MRKRRYSSRFNEPIWEQSKVYVGALFPFVGVSKNAHYINL